MAAARQRLSARLQYRSWRWSDLPSAVSLWGDPQVTRYIDQRPRLDLAAVRDRLASEIDRDRRSGLQYWPVFTHADGEFVGCCGLRPYPARDDCLEIGFHIRRSAWGRGYASEAARAVIAMAFEHFGVTTLFAGHHPENVVSRGLLLKLGFVHRASEYYAPTGLLHPAYWLESPQVKTTSGNE
jgi:RimJ/RimL family protein N-acetyltransferase